MIVRRKYDAHVVSVELGISRMRAASSRISCKAQQLKDPRNSSDARPLQIIPPLENHLNCWQLQLLEWQSSPPSFMLQLSRSRSSPLSFPQSPWHTASKPPLQSLQFSPRAKNSMIYRGRSPTSPAPHYPSISPPYVHGMPQEL